MTSTPRSPLPAPSGDVELLERLAGARRDLLAHVGQRIVGQKDVLDGILTAIFSGGHALLVGVPGLAKTLMVQTVSEALDLKFTRIQFTPDLMPSDITGTEIIEEDLATGKRAFRFVRGPVFANIVLADAPPGARIDPRCLRAQTPSHSRAPRGRDTRSACRCYRELSPRPQR